MKNTKKAPKKPTAESARRKKEALSLKVKTSLKSGLGESSSES